MVASEGLLHYSRFDYKKVTLEKLNFFEYREPAFLPKTDTVDQILGSFPDDPQDSPSLSTPWRPREDQRYGDYLKDPNYIPPDKLPESIDEKLWAKQEGLDSDYIPPDKLPVPIDENIWEK